MTVVRAAEPSDLPALTDIYNHYVRYSPATFDTTEFTVDGRREWFGHYADVGRASAARGRRCRRRRRLRDEQPIA